MDISEPILFASGREEKLQHLGYLHLRPPQVFTRGFVASDAWQGNALQGASVTPLVKWGHFLPFLRGCCGI